jgi:hypothetical protein
MSGYRRFLLRGGARIAAHSAAEVAEAAEVEAVQGLQAAEALLKPAEVHPRDRQRQQASAEVQHQQSAGIHELQQLQQLQQAAGPKIVETRDLASVSPAPPSHPEQDGGSPRSGLPPKWCEGVLWLSTMPPPPRGYPEHAWRQLVIDAERFLDDWAAQAAALGWPDWELFGCHRRAPWGRIQGMGLVLLLRGDLIAALTETEAVIRTPTGARQTYRRQLRDPLDLAERCLVWELS